MQIAIVAVVLACLVSLNAWATWKVLRDEFSTRSQRIAQTAFVWLVPLLGGLLALRLNGDARERPSGRYAAGADLGDNDGLSAEPGWDAGGDHAGAAPGDMNFLD